MPTKADVYGRVQAVDQGHRGWIPAWPKGMENTLPPQGRPRRFSTDTTTHTVNCKSCSVALANLTKARKVLKVASLVALAVAAAAFARQMPTMKVVGAALLSAALAGVREFFGGLIGKMHVGPYPPPRRPPSMMEAALESARIANI